MCAKISLYAIAYIFHISQGGLTAFSYLQPTKFPSFKKAPKPTFAQLIARRITAVSIHFYPLKNRILCVNHRLIESVGGIWQQDILFLRRSQSVKIQSG